MEDKVVDGYEMFHDHMNRDANILYGIVTEVFRDDILDSRRYRNLVDARKVYSHIVRQSGYPYSDIGRYMKKNHATVMHHCTDAPYIIKSDPELKQKYLLCRSRYLEAIGNANYIREDKANKKLIDTMQEKDSYIDELEQKIQHLQDKSEVLKERVSWYEGEFGFYKKELRPLYQIITDRTKSKTVEQIAKKLNTMYNGVYSTVIEVY